MSKQRLFEFAVIHHPVQTEEQRKQGIEPKSELIVDLTRILEGDEQRVGMRAARLIPENYLDKLEQVEIVVRPF